jgi:hypothetical protein
MVTEGDEDSKRRIRRNVVKVSKAAVKALVVCIVYVILARFLAPVSMMITGFQEMIETLLIVYVVLMLIGDLTSGTIVQHFFNAAKSLFVMIYLVFTLNHGIFEYTFGNVNIMVDLRLFLIIAMLIGLLGLAKSVLQAIDYVGERAELARV